MSRRLATTFALVLVMTLAMPTIAGAVIRVNKGIFGVSLGQSQKQVKRKLGRPNDVNRSRGHIRWFYDRKQLMVSFRSRTKRVVSLFTDNPRERTPTGVGVGSTEEQVLAGVPGVRCSDFRGARLCGVYGVTAATIFGLEAGRVIDVDVLR